MIERETLFLSNITIPAHRARGLNPDAVARLAESVKRIGLQTPISVRYDDASGDVVLVAGLHRLEAARQLGWETIPAIYTEGTADDARMWEIAENLHRADLSALERAEHVAEWIRLSADAVHVEPHQKAGQQPGGVRAAARELGIDRNDAHRAIKVDGLSPEAKAAARQAGLDDNRAAMLRAASEPSPAAELAAIKRDAELADARKANAETDKLIKERRVEAVKEWLARRMDVTEMHDLGEMLVGLCDPISRALMREAA